MRTPLLIILICLTTILQAQDLDLKGIRIENADYPVIVYINRKQACTPVNSCFISNLRPGEYQIEVYESRARDSRHKRPNKDKMVYSTTLHYDGSGIKDIIISQGNNDNSGSCYDEGMNERMFEEFYKTFKSASFDSERDNILKITLATARFTSEQALALSKIYSFDSSRLPFLKKIYPNIVDKEGFFIVFNSLDFSSSKDQLTKFIEGYHKSH